MPIRSRGELPDPCITAIRDQYTRPQSLNIDTDVYIELTMVNTPDCQIYFTTDGSVPAPHKRYMGDREVTFRYRAPFALKSGKRVIRVVAMSRDGLLTSRVVSKTFTVHGSKHDTYDTYDAYDAYDSSDAYLDEDSSDFCWDTDTSTADRGRRRTWTTCKSWHDQGRNSRKTTRPVSAGRGWIASSRRYPYNVQTLDGEPKDRRQQSGQGPVQIPDGPFNPVNYSGMQINVWGGPPPNVWPATSGVASYGGVAPTTTIGHLPRPTVQRGLLTKSMLENSGAPGTNSSSRALENSDDDNRPLTVADVRRILAAEAEAEASAAEASAAEASAAEASAAEASASASEDHRERTKRKSSKGLRSGGNVSFSGLARSGKVLLSSYRGKKK